MKKIISTLLILNLFPAQLWALTPAEEACKKFVEEEMYTRGMVNKRVCMNTTDYPNIRVNTNISDIESGKSNKPLKPEDIRAMAGLEGLLNGALDGVKDAHKEVVGYTDGEIAVYPSFDGLFFKNVGAKSPEDFQISQKAGANYTMELDDVKVKNYIAGIKDEATKAKLEDLIKNKKSSTVNFNKKGSGESAEFHPQGDNQLLVDILRNHALSIKRTEDFCDKTANPVECKKNQKGVTSVALLEKSGSADPSLTGYHGQCGGRRGVSYNFYFPDEMKKNTDVEPGVYEPSFNIPGRDIQNNMQLSAAMDFFKKIQTDKKNFPEVDAKDVSKMEQSKFFGDYDADRTRFKDWLKGQNSGCADNDYQVDNQRRFYWAMNKELLDAKTILKNDKSAKKADYEQMLDSMGKGDFAELKLNPKFAKIYELATKPYPHGQTDPDTRRGFATDYILALEDELKNNFKPQELSESKRKRLTELQLIKRSNHWHNNCHKDGAPITDAEENELANLETEQSEGRTLTKLDNSDKQMIVAMRTMIIGRPVYHQDFSGKLKHEYIDNRFYIYDGTLPKGDDRRSDGIYKRYSRDNGIDDIANIGFPPADVFACHDVSDALVENMKSDGSNLVMNLGRTGEESKDKNTWDEIKFSPGSVKTIEINGSSAGYNESKENEWNMLEKGGFIEKGSVNGSNMTTHGWVCQECGSGVHVHADGSVHPVSRQRDGTGSAGRKLNNEANMTFDVTKNDDFSMSSLQHLKVYVFNDCANCDCVKNFKNGDDFKAKLASGGAIHNMVTYNNEGKPVIDPTKNNFKVEDPKTCMYVAPVPHSCNYDPAGESPEKKINKEVRESLYCKLKTIMEGDKFKTANPKLDGLKASDASGVMTECQKSVFPQTEASCLDKFLKKGSSTNGSKPTGVLDN